MKTMLLKLSEEEKCFYILFSFFAFSKEPHFLGLLQSSLHVCLSLLVVEIYLSNVLTVAQKPASQ